MSLSRTHISSWPFFFVLSGFVIGTRYERTLPGETAPFLIRRFGRLWPLQAATLALFVAVAIVQGDIGTDVRHSIPSIFTNLAMIHGLGMHSDLTWNGPSWSISVEFLLYLLFAALSLSRRRSYVYVGLIIASLIILTQWAPHGMASTYDFGLFRGIAGFFTGVLIARLPVRKFGSTAEIFLLLGVVIFVVAGTFQFLSPIIFGLAVFVFAGGKGLISKVLVTKPMLLLGQWSYSIYMVHAAVVAVIWAIAKPLGLTPAGPHLRATLSVELGVAAAYIGVVLVTSAITYRLIEDPARKWFNRLASKPSVLRRSTVADAA